MISCAGPDEPGGGHEWTSALTRCRRAEARVLLLETMLRAVRASPDVPEHVRQAIETVGIRD